MHPRPAFQCSTCPTTPRHRRPSRPLLSKVPDADASPTTALLDLPHDPEASDGHLDLRELLGQGQKGNPVPIPHKTLHQATDLNSLLRRRGWHNQGESGTLWSKSIILRKKERPDLTTLGMVQQTHQRLQTLSAGRPCDPPMSPTEP